MEYLYIIIFILFLSSNVNSSSPKQFQLPLSFNPSTNQTITQLTISNKQTIAKSYNLIVDFKSTTITVSSSSLTSNEPSTLQFNEATKLKQFPVTFGSYYGNEEGIIGLSYDNELLSRLYLNKQISYKMFSIGINPISNIVTIDIGKLITQNINNHKNNYITCNMFDNTYQCSLDSITRSGDIQSKFSPSSLTFKLDISKRFIYCPINFLFFLDEYYFNDLVINEKCNLGLVDGEYTFICFDNNYDIFNTLPHLIFNFGENKIMALEARKLFVNNNEDNLEFIFRTSKSDIENKKDFRAGLEFFNIFTTVIDIERNEMGFYNEKYIFAENVKEQSSVIYPISLSSINSDIIINIYYVLIIMMLIEIAVFSYMKWGDRMMTRKTRKVKRNIKGTNE